MVKITALSSYLSEDLYEYFEHEPERGDAFWRRPDLSFGSYSGCDAYSCKRVSRRKPEHRVAGTGCCFEHDHDRYSRPAGRPPLRNAGTAYCCFDDVYPEGVLAGRRVRPGCVRSSRRALPAERAASALIASLTKKFRDEITDQAEANAKAKFLRINDACRDWKLNPQFSWEEELLGTFKQELDNFFHPGGELLIPDYATIFDRGRTGPGASLGANGVDFYTKLFSSNLTATSLEVYYQYAAWCAGDSNWRDAEFTRLTTFGLPHITLESSMSFVQKNRDTKRTICTEPNLNMYAQLGLGALLEDRLGSYFGIDLSVQPDRNAELARLGSIHGSFSTIDLESASDSLSLGMLEWALPDWVFETLLMYRCPLTRLRGEQVRLNMISTMGNGYTFPLQTIIFSCAVQAVAKQADVRLGRADSKKPLWGVFGDDIALPTSLSERLCRLLSLLGFYVNSEKSYIDRYGSFRESCGRDYYRGHNVRGVYIKTLRSPQSRYVAINLLNEWSARWGIPLRRTIGYLRDSVRIMAIPPWVAEDSGIRIPLEALRSGYIQVYRSDKWRYSYLFRHYVPDMPFLTVKEDSIAIPRNLNRVPRRVMNPSGLLIAAIGGYLRDSRIPLALKQGEDPNYRTRTGVTPFWGPTVEQVRSYGPVFWERWNTAVLDNLGF